MSSSPWPCSPSKNACVQYLRVQVVGGEVGGAGISDGSLHTGPHLCKTGDGAGSQREEAAHVPQITSCPRGVQNRIWPKAFGLRGI